jgi:rubrerythrin
VQPEDFTMPMLTGREHCLQHPAHALRAYGVGVFFAALLKKKTSLLQLLAEHFAAHGYPMPGELGRAYRLAALLELRMARFYAALAARFADTPEAAALFQELSDEEEEHSRLMQLCRYTVMLGPTIQFVPHLHDADIKVLLRRLRHLRTEIHELSLDQALHLTVELERSEINSIFDMLLRQAAGKATEPFAAVLQDVGDHATSVPSRIAQLRQRLVA